MISIVIPTYRRADLLQRLLDSIHAQTFKDYEVIVVDDASPNREDYARLVEGVRARFLRFEYHRLDENRGAPHARNVGIRVARGEWIALVDDDDEWLAEKLALQESLARQSPPQVGLIYTWTRALDGDGRLLYESTPEVEGHAIRHIFTTNFIMSSSVIVRREVFETAGLFDERLPSCQDWDMWARVLAAGYACRVVRRVVTLYHRHGQPSVGLSSRALQGYRLFLEKHWKRIMSHTDPVNWLKKGWLYSKTRLAPILAP